MNWQKIDKILDKYIKGLTSIEEEQELRSAMNRSDVPEHLRPYRHMFDAFEIQRLPKGPYEQELDRWLKLETEDTEEEQKSFVMWRSRIAIAAAVAIIMATSFVFINNSGLFHSYSEKEVLTAYDQAKEVFSFISVKMNEGITPAQPIGLLNSAEKPLQKMNLLNSEIEKTANQINKFNTYKNKVTTPLKN